MEFQYIGSLWHVLKDWAGGNTKYINPTVVEMVEEKLKELENHFMVAPHAFIATEAALLSHAAGLPLPSWVADWVCAGLETFYRTEGAKRSLQELLGFTSKQRVGTVFNANRLENRNIDLVYDVLLLENYCNIPLDTALKLVLEAHNCQSTNSTLCKDTFDKYFQEYRIKLNNKYFVPLQKEDPLLIEYPWIPLNIFLPYIIVAKDNQIIKNAELVSLIAELVTRAGMTANVDVVKYAEAMINLIINNPSITSNSDPFCVEFRITKIMNKLSTKFTALEK